MFHPRSRNDQGDYCRQADLMSAQRLVCLRHDAGNFPGPYDDHAWIARWIFSKKSASLLIHVNTGHHFV